jgi:hypothetical protein
MAHMAKAMAHAAWAVAPLHAPLAVAGPCKQETFFLS